VGSCNNVVKLQFLFFFLLHFYLTRGELQLENIIVLA